MIHFDLRCEGGHRFDGWFRSGADFERQITLGLVACPTCASVKVEKALMRPAVALKSAPAPVETPQTSEPTSPAGPLPAGPVAAKPQEAHAVAGPEAPAAAAMAKLYQALQAHARVVREKAENVGPRFAEEARRIHYDEAEKRGIYGEATRQEVEALHEEGIVAVPLPPLPEDHN
ncbi:hypothetical protein SAMN06297251_101173 [Fulvimarina manganoxydans]|uniref:DUF1178 family protein n=1 Tax=Fulvimarina manganoxydans TaxID=937218 RepID=A0A1W1YCS8_9HYPH|nr:DUF1178 family protein [Fulvimarina manganoxydans]MEE2952778.1 DUF1178 family protein [Pseudomonadota bacterium]SMC33924.1 hypothetical protein SAMN06297251_101173 [Fulvimarina manganoxydans]